MQSSQCSLFFSAEINGTNADVGKRLEGGLDAAFLFSYALFMFLSGLIAERVDLRFFLSAGMVLSGVFCMLFGFAYYWGIHTIVYFILVQVRSAKILVLC